MANDLRSWRQKKDVIRSEHTKEVVKEELPENVKKVIFSMAKKIEHLERSNAAVTDALRRLALEARKRQ